MSDAPTAPPSPLLEANEFDGKSLSELEDLRQALLAGKTSFDEMSEAEVERYIAICAACRLAGRSAAKPAGAGGSAETKKRAKRAPSTKSLEDLLRTALGKSTPTPTGGA